MINSLFFSCIDCPTRPTGPLGEVPSELLTELSKARVTNIYKKGQTVFYEGNRPYGVYCLNSGKVKLIKHAPEGKSYISRISKAGDLLGYRAFFTNEFYTSTAEVLEDAVICFLDKEKFLDLLKKNPQFSLKLLEMMGHELKCAEEHSRDLAYKSAQERIIELILTLKDSYGKDQENGTYKLDIQLSREDMASMLGTTTETAVRLLTWLKDKNLVEIRQKHMFILNINGLQEMLPDY